MSSKHEIPITIADILIEVQSPLSISELGIGKRFGPFFSMPDNPIARISLCWEESKEAPVPRGELVYDPGAIWRMFRARSDYYALMNYLEEDPSAVEMTAPGVLRANAVWDDLTLTEQRSGARWTSLLNIGAGELLVRTKMVLTDGLVFHASGIDDNGRGIVFVGHSGAGKSTQAGLWSSLPGVIGMNDDRIAVRPSAGGAVCYGTPWGGTLDIASNHHAPLSALILVEQAPENEIIMLSPDVSAPLLLARTFLPYWDKSLMLRAFANLNMILERVPVYRLRWRPEQAVIQLVRSVL